MRPGQLIIIAILILLFVIGSTGALIFQERFVKCKEFKQKWCYLDWKCLSTAGTEISANSISPLIANCSPISAEKAAALNAAGKRNIYPGSLCANCALCTHIDTDQNCPPYTEGSIDWTRCTPAVGCTTANGCVF